MTSLTTSLAPRIVTLPGNLQANRDNSAAPPQSDVDESHLTLLRDDVDATTAASDSTAGVDLVWAVDQFYTSLYKFGFSLAGNASDAADLTQETYRVLLTKGREIRDPGKVKSWLFTTLYRLFLRRRRRSIRFPETQFESLEWELPTPEPEQGERLDGSLVVAALQRLEEKFRTPLAMFYLQELSYKEMADVLGLPIGTIMSRLFRGKALLRRELQPVLPIAV